MKKEKKLFSNSDAGRLGKFTGREGNLRHALSKSDTSYATATNFEANRIYSAHRSHEIPRLQTPRLGI